MLDKLPARNPATIPAKPSVTLDAIHIASVVLRTPFAYRHDPEAGTIRNTVPWSASVRYLPASYETLTAGEEQAEKIEDLDTLKEQSPVVAELLNQLLPVVMAAVRRKQLLAAIAAADPEDAAAIKGLQTDLAAVNAQLGIKG